MNMEKEYFCFVSSAISFFFHVFMTVWMKFLHQIQKIYLFKRLFRPSLSRESKSDNLFFSFYSFFKHYKREASIERIENGKGGNVNSDEIKNGWKDELSQIEGLFYLKWHQHYAQLLLYVLLFQVVDDLVVKHQVQLESHHQS